MDIILVHAASKHPIHIQDNASVDELKKIVTEKTMIPSFKQKLIYKGVAISKDDSKVLKDFKIKSNAKIMVIGQKHDPEEEGILKNLDMIEKRIEKIEVNFADLKCNIDSVQKGFMEKTLLSKSIESLNKTLLRYTEDGMQIMESLDGIQIDENFKDARTKKKNLIKKIQALLDKCDIVADKLSSINEE